MYNITVTNVRKLRGIYVQTDRQDKTKGNMFMLIIHRDVRFDHSWGDWSSLVCNNNNRWTTIDRAIEWESTILIGTSVSRVLDRPSRTMKGKYRREQTSDPLPACYDHWWLVHPSTGWLVRHPFAFQRWQSHSHAIDRSSKEFPHHTPDRKPWQEKEKINLTKEQQ